MDTTKQPTRAECELNQWTVSEVAERLGLRDYDTALPQDWVNKCFEHDYDPRGQLVVSYDGPGCFGQLIPLTTDAAKEIPPALIW